MDSYIQYSHEALCLLLERKDCEIERLTAKLAECTEEAARLKQNIVDTLTERLSDVETARKQAAREILHLLDNADWACSTYEETYYQAVCAIKSKFGLQEG